MKKIFLNALLLSGLIFLFSECKKDKRDVVKKEGVKRGDAKLDNAELSMVPYSLNDSVTFRIP